MPWTLAGIVFGSIVAAITSEPLEILEWAVIGFLVGAIAKLHRKIDGLEKAAVAEPVSARTPEAPIRPSAEPAPRAAEASRRAIPVAPPPRVDEARAPATPAGPNFVEKTVRYFSTGNVIAKVGVALLFIGVSFLLKYVSERGLLPIELRLTGAALGALGLLGLGWRLRRKNGPYGLILQGAGVGILYLTVFAAYRLYHLLPPAAAFGLMVVTVVLSSCLAVLQDARSLAVCGVTGGFLAPILASTGQGSHVALFSYYALLNLGVLFMAWFRSWRALHLVGFAFTFVIGGTWGAKYYRPEYFASTEPFLIFFFVLYVAIAVRFAEAVRADKEGFVDGSLVFGVPVAAFSLQAGLVKAMDYGLAWSATAFAGFYLALGWALFRRRGEDARRLVESFFAVGVCFLTLAVPFALDGTWTAAVWGLEGVAIAWIGVRQRRRSNRWAGMALQVLAGGSFVLSDARAAGAIPIGNAFGCGVAILAFSHAFVGWLLHRAPEDGTAPWEKALSPLFLAGGVAWWVIGGFVELHRAVPEIAALVLGEDWRVGGFHRGLVPHADVLFLALSAALADLLGRRGHWEALRRVRWGMMPLAAFFALILLVEGGHPSANIGALAWIAAFAVHAWTLRARESAQNLQPGSVQPLQRREGWVPDLALPVRAGRREPRIIDGAAFSPVRHYVAFWLLTFLLTWEAHAQAARFVYGIWTSVVLLAVPAFLAVAVLRAKAAALWPIGPHRARYLGLGLAPHFLWMGLWVTILNVSADGNPVFLPYVAILNPLDVAQFGIWLLAVLWYVEAKKSRLPQLPPVRPAAAVLGATVFVGLTAALLRALHHWADVPWNATAVFASNLAQAALSLFWSAVAMALMAFAGRRRWRGSWFAGAALLGIVVLKLFAVDLSGRGTLARIVSFVGTGIVLLGVGYLTPLPPQRSDRAREES